MITTSLIKEAIIKAGQRLFKVDQIGAKSGLESLPFGFDSNPVKDMVALYASTSNDSESFIIGYINKHQIAKPGESRLFSLDSDGNVSSFVYLQENGKIQLNGDAHSAIRFAPLNVELQALTTAINLELVKIASGIATAGGAYTPDPVSINISSAENDTIKIS